MRSRLESAGSRGRSSRAGGWPFDPPSSRRPRTREAAIVPENFVTSSFQGLLSAVREACPPGLWSQGVKLAREGAVFSRHNDVDSVTLRVESPGKVVAPTVTLYPADVEWTCDCGGRVDPCAHVAAAAIFITQPAAPVSAVATGAGGARLRYQLDPVDGWLTLKRVVVYLDGREEPLKGSLGSPTTHRALVRPTHDDLEIDRYVGTRQYGYFPKDRVEELLGALAGAEDVRLGDRKIHTSRESISPRVTVFDEGHSVVLLIEADSRIDEIIVTGIARVEGAIHPLSETALSGGRLERLPLRRVFAKADLAELVSEVLPSLEGRMPIDVRSRRLPRTGAIVRPRIAIDLTQDRHTLSVLPTLVYGDPTVAHVSGGKLIHIKGAVPIRDEATERALVARLRDELHLVPGRRVDFNGADAIRFAQRLERFQKSQGGSKHELFSRGSLAPKFKLDDDRFDLDFELSVNGEPTGTVISGAAVLRAYEDGLPLVPLDGGGWAPLPTAFLEQHGTKILDLLEARRDDGTIGPAAIPLLAQVCEALDAPPPASYARLAPLMEGFQTLPEATLPSDLQATLRPYQHYGVNWLCFMRDAGLGAVLADDMGLGKTLQTICALQGRSLIVCPRSVVHNWAEELQRFRPGLRVHVYQGPKRAVDPEADVTLTTYTLLRLDVESLADQSWDIVVLDEAQAIKNPDSQVSRAAFDLKADFRVSLSGTPVENRLEELWSLLHFSNRGLLGGRSRFQEQYGRPIGDGAPGVAEQLRKKIRPFVLRRLKRDVAPELPPRSDSVLYCELEDSERALYDAVRAATQKDIVSKLAEGASVLAALEALLRLRQAACHGSLLPGQSVPTSSKVSRLVDALEDAAADGHKALVFSQWTSLLDLIEPQLRAAGIRFTRLDGSTRDRASVVDSFQDPEGPPVMLISLKAGGTGLNLTAADHVFLMDPWWNPAVEDQAADRAHRIGQDRPVMVYRLVAKDTVEEKILALQERKRRIADAALGEAEHAAGLTREDLLDLLR